FDANGRFVGVHTGVCDGDVHYNVNGSSHDKQWSSDGSSKKSTITPTNDILLSRINRS
ncbi:unnamed protein product, partial [Rotaria sp. Silwood1]